MNYIDLAEIKSLADGGPYPYGGERYLSSETVLYILAVANSQRWQWRNGGDRLSDAEWDEAESIIGRAFDELMEPVVEGCPGDNGQLLGYCPERSGFIILF